MTVDGWLAALAVVLVLLVMVGQVLLLRRKPVAPVIMQEGQTVDLTPITDRIDTLASRVRDDARQAMAREPRSSPIDFGPVLRAISGLAGRVEGPAPIAGGEAVGLELVHQRLDDVLASMSALHQDITRRPAGALPLATEKPKEHRPQFVVTSEERTNKLLRYICTCRVDGCQDTLILEQAEMPAIPGGQN